MTATPSPAPTGSAQFPVCTPVVTVDCIYVEPDGYAAPAVPTVLEPAPAPVVEVGTVAPASPPALAETGPASADLALALAVGALVAGVVLYVTSRRR